MRLLRLRADLSLLREGVDVAVGFGVRSLEGLGGVAEFIEHAVYEPRSLEGRETGVSFVLRNPPLRMGAFESVRAAVDGVWSDPARSTVEPSGSGGPRRLDSLDRGHPVTLPIGRRTRFVLGGIDPRPRRARVRLELVSVAIPPRVWYEFVDEIRPMGAEP